MSKDPGGNDTLRFEIPGQCNGLVLAKIFFIEPLAVQVADFDNVVVENSNRSNAFPDYSRSNVGDEPACTDADHATAREDILVESGNLALPVFRSREWASL